MHQTQQAITQQRMHLVATLQKIQQRMLLIQQAAIHQRTVRMRQITAQTADSYLYNYHKKWEAALGSPL